MIGSAGTKECAELPERDVRRWRADAGADAVVTVVEAISCPAVVVAVNLIDGWGTHGLRDPVSGQWKLAPASGLDEEDVAARTGNGDWGRELTSVRFEEK